jgi:hypothetical protein
VEQRISNFEQSLLCQKWRAPIMKNCPDSEQIAAYLEHQLSPSEDKQIKDHLIKCQACRNLVGRVVKNESVVKGPIISRKLDTLPTGQNPTRNFSREKKFSFN